MKSMHSRYRRRILYASLISAFFALLFLLFILAVLFYNQYVLLPGEEPVFSRQELSAVLLLSLAAVLVFILVFVQSQHTHITYMEEIARAMARIADGDFDCAIEIRGDDELSDIAAQLDTMIAQLRRMMETERTAEQSKNELMANIAHDLRTPLTVVLGYLELLNSGRELDTSQQQHYLEIVTEKARRLQSMIEDLFGFTKLGHDALPLSISRLDLVQLLIQLLDEFFPLFEQNQLTYEFSTNRDSVFLEADGNLLARLFDNLINNAIKYGREGRLIRVSLSADDSTAVIRVINYGTVIPKEALGRIFEKFYRADAVRSTTGGTGLGLAIAAHIAEIHGGSITASSDLSGTVFQVQLPLQHDFDRRFPQLHSSILNR